MRIHTIPPVFYGGSDPNIYGSNTGVEKDTKRQTEPSSLYTTSSDYSRKKIYVYSIIGIVSILVISGITWYYLREYQHAQREADRIREVARVPVETVDEIVSTSTADGIDAVVTSSIATATTTVDEPISDFIDTVTVSSPQFNFPVFNLQDGIDIDQDQLTDVEEELYGTDSGGWDTDGDGYFDGQEVLNLYNPKGLSPTRLIDSGFFREYTNPLTRYRMYYPAQWQLGSVDTAGRHVLFSSIRGDYVEVYVVEKDPADDFASWFGKTVIGQKLTDLRQFVNRFDMAGWKRSDQLVAYLEDQRFVYVIIYQASGSGPIMYRHTFQTMLQSFRLDRTIRVLPTQPTIPSESVSEASDDVVDVVPSATSTP